MKSRKLLVANWKMNGSFETNEDLFYKIINFLPANFNEKGVDITLCPPFVYLHEISQFLTKSATNINLGAQNVSSKQNGAYTGQISVTMLEDFLVKKVIVGHSESRSYNHETSLEVAEKVKYILMNSKEIYPILCVGETFEQKENNQTEAIIADQLLVVLNLLKDTKLTENKDIIKRLIIAYEPIWAIGTGMVATIDIAENVCKFIRSIIEKISLELSDKVRIIYGGSVKSDNAFDLIKQPNIDGFLVGGASLDATQFVNIYNNMCD